MALARIAGAPQWNPTEAQLRVFQEWRLTTIQHLVSSKKGIQPFKLPGMLKELTDEKVPLDKMGFLYPNRTINKINVFLYEMRDAIEARKVDHKLYIFVRESSIPKELQHIRKMVLGQSGKGDKPLRHHGVPVPATILLQYEVGSPFPQQARPGIGYRPNNYVMPLGTHQPVNNFRGSINNQPGPSWRSPGTGLSLPATTRPAYTKPQPGPSTPVTPPTSTPKPMSKENSPLPRPPIFQAAFGQPTPTPEPSPQQNLANLRSGPVAKAEAVLNIVEPETVSVLKKAAQVKDKPMKNFNIRYGYSIDTNMGLHYPAFKTIPKPVPMKDFVAPPPIYNFQCAVIFPPFLVTPATSFKTFLKTIGQLDKFMDSM